MIDYSAELELLRGVTPGDIRKVSALYSVAAMWLRAGESLHPDHAAWLADRLDDLAGAIESANAKDLRSAAWGTSGKGGRKSLDAPELGKRRIAVMHYAQLRGTMGHGELVKRVAAGALLTDDEVRDAWKKRRKLFPDLFPVTGD